MSRTPDSPDTTADPELREIFVRHGLRVAAAFAVLFGFVFFAFWWSGSAVRFSADRASGGAMPAWRVSGTVRSAATGTPVPWAVVEDEPTGKAPFYHTDANYSGAFELLTLAEPHRIRASAPGFHPASVAVGRQWFLWLPKGNEKRDIQLQPE